MSNQSPTRVNIQFSLDLDELPDEIGRLLSRSHACITKSAEAYTTLKNSSSLLTNETWKEVEDLRMNLSKADLILDDVHKILGGYLQMTTEQYTSQEAEEAMPGPEIQTNAAPAPVETPPDGYPPGIQSNHPTHGPQSRQARKMQNMQMQSQLAALVNQIQQNQGASQEDMTEEEIAASNIMKKRMERMMGVTHEESPESSEPKI